MCENILAQIQIQKYIKYVKYVRYSFVKNMKLHKHPYTRFVETKLSLIIFFKFLQIITSKVQCTRYKDFNILNK